MVESCVATWLLCLPAGYLNADSTGDCLSCETKDNTHTVTVKKSIQMTGYDL